MAGSSDLVPLPEEPATPRLIGEPVDAPSSEQATRAVIGVALLLADATRAVTDRFASNGTHVRDDATPTAGELARRVGIGVAFEAQRRTERAVQVVNRVGGPAVSWFFTTPVVRPVTRRVGARLDALYEAGAREEDRAREVASRATSESVQLAVPVVLDAVDLEPILVQVLDKVDIEQLLGAVLDKVEVEPLMQDLLAKVDVEGVMDTLLDQVPIGDIINKVLDQVDLKPVIDRVLDQLDLPDLVGRVMDELDLDPIVRQVLGQMDLSSLVQEVVAEIQLSSVVMQATGGITDDVIGGVRNRGIEADAVVERITARLLRRKRAAGALPPIGLPDEHADELLAELPARAATELSVELPADPRAEPGAHEGDPA